MLVEVGTVKYVVNWKHEREFDRYALVQDAQVSGDAKLLRALELSTGRTICRIEKLGGTSEVEATVYCSKKDIFEKDEGRKRSLKRALALRGFMKQERTLFWDEYHNRKPQTAEAA